MKTQLVILAALAGVGYLGYRKLAAGIDAGALDITSDKNLAYSGVTKVGKVLTGDEHFSLGGWIYDKTHPNEAALLGLSEPVKALPIIKKGEVLQ